jgi:hypothetical protein
MKKEKIYLIINLIFILFVLVFISFGNYKWLTILLSLSGLIIILLGQFYTLNKRNKDR